MFSLTQDQLTRLDSLQSGVKISHQSASGNQPDKTVAKLSSNISGKNWAKAEVPGQGDEAEKQAITAVLDSADPSKRPRSVAEIAEENVDLRKKIESYEKGNAQTPEDKDDTDDTDGAGTSLSPSQLVQALQARGIEVPDGNKRSNEWRKKAEALIK